MTDPDILDLLGDPAPVGHNGGPPPRARGVLRHYQVWTAEKIKALFGSASHLPGLIFAFPMGSGKTGATLTALRDLLDQFVIRKVLVVAPLLVAQTVWPDEIEAWVHTRALSWTLLRVEDGDSDVAAAGRIAYRNRPLGMSNGDAAKLRAAAEMEAKQAKLAALAADDTEIHIVNKEALPWLWKHFGAAWPYDIVVIDEASILKNGQKRTAGKIDDAGKKVLGELSRFGALCASRKHTLKVIELTGTPAPKGVHNLWGLAYYVDLGARLGVSKSAFEGRWFSKDSYTFKITPHAHSEAEIMSKLKDIMFSLDPKDLSELPPMQSNIIKVKLPDKALQSYRKFKKEMVSEEYDVEAVNSGVLHNKLLQFANGSMYQEGGEDVWVHDAKIDALARIVEDTDGEPLLVAYSYQFDLRRILKRFPKAVVLNETNPRDFVRRWNAGEIEMGLAHPMSAAHGLNLQYGGHHAVWYGLTADLELYLQFNMRLLRPGQTDTVFNHHIIAEGTIDERILPVFLDPKAATQDRVLDAVRVDLAA